MVLKGDGSGGTPPEGDASGNSLSFDSTYYDVDSQILRVDLFGDIQSADEISIKGGLSVYTDSNYESVIPNAITSVMPMEILSKLVLIMISFLLTPPLQEQISTLNMMVSLASWWVRMAPN